MNIGTYIVVLFVFFYIKYFLDLADVRNRKGTISKNERLEVLRRIPVKSREEQEEFITLRYPKKVKVPWTIKRITTNIIMLIFYAGIIVILMQLFDYFHITVKLWVAITIIFIGPIVINFLLKSVGLEKSDITVFFR
jgi:hypothetical protein